MQQDLNEVLAASLLPLLLHLVQGLRPFAGVGSIDIEKEDVAAGFANAGDDLFDLRHVLAAIKMHAEDIESASAPIPGLRRRQSRSTNPQSSPTAWGFQFPS